MKLDDNLYGMNHLKGLVCGLWTAVLLATELMDDPLPKCHGVHGLTFVSLSRQGILVMKVRRIAGIYLRGSGCRVAKKELGYSPG